MLYSLEYGTTAIRKQSEINSRLRNDLPIALCGAHREIGC